MNHLDFVIWTLLFPVVISVCKKLDGKSTASEGDQSMSAVIVLCIWGGVSYLLY